MRQARVLVLLLALASLFGSCVNNPTTQQGGAGTASTTGGYQRKVKKAGEPVYIGFSMDTLKEERWNRDKALVEARAKEVGARAVEGADAVAWTVGDLSDFGPAFLRRRVTLYSGGTHVLIAAMGRAGARRLVAVTGVGAGDSRRSGGWLDAWVLLPLLRGAIYADKDRQEALVRASDTDWTILRPGFLTNGPATGTSRALIDVAGVRAGRISRAEVARGMLACLTEGRHLREVVLLTE